jgi:outer membrane protein assembly factor BamB
VIQPVLASAVRSSVRVLLARLAVGAMVAGVAGLSGCASSGCSGCCGGCCGEPAGEGAVQATAAVPTKPAAVSAEAAKAAAAKAEAEKAWFSRLGYKADWTGVAAVQRGQVVRHVDVLGDLVVVQDGGNAVSGLNVANGLVRWSTLIDSPLTQFFGSVRSGSRLLASSDSNLFVVDTESGAVITRQPFARVVATRPAAVGPALVYGTATNQVVAHAPGNGFQAWGYFIQGPISHAPVVIGDRDVGVVSQDGEVVILDGITALPRGRARIFGGVDCDLAASDDALFVASLDQSLYAFESNNAAQRWRIRTQSPMRHKPVYHNGRLFVTIPETGFSAVDASSGKVLWSVKTLTGVAVAQRGSELLVDDGKGLTVLEVGTGDLIRTVELPGKSLFRAPGFADGPLYVVTEAGAVFKLSPKAN